MILEPNAPLAGAFKTTKMIKDLFLVILIQTMKMLIVRCIFYDSEANRPLSPSSKDMKMITAPRISYYDSDASRPPPAHFQTHENGYGPLHFLSFLSQQLLSRALPNS